MPRDEKLLNLCLAASVFGWAVAACLAARPDDRGAAALWCVVALHGLVAFLFATRGPVRLSGSIRQILACLPAVAIGGLAWKLAPPPGEWPLAAGALFVTGTLLASTSLLTLGRSFAVLPALRDIVERGPYRLIRHPAYAGEMLMVAGCAAAAGDSAIAAVLLPVTALLLFVRIRAEEQVLANSETYRDYTRRVTHRVLPFVW